MPDAALAALRVGSLGISLTAASNLLPLGTLALVTAMLRTREGPVAPLVQYAAGAVSVALGAFVHEALLDAGLAVLAVRIAWLPIWRFGRSDRIMSRPRRGGRPAKPSQKASPFRPDNPTGRLAPPLDALDLPV